MAQPAPYRTGDACHASGPLLSPAAPHCRRPGPASPHLGGAPGSALRDPKLPPRLRGRCQWRRERPRWRALPGQGSLKVEGLTGARMHQVESPGMQPQPAIGAATAGMAIERIPQDRVTQPGQMDPQLVRTTGVGLQPQPAPASPPLQAPPIGATGPTGGMHPIERWPVAGLGQGRLHPPGRGRRPPGHIGQVGASHPPRLQGHRKAPVGLRIAGEQQQARGVAIEAMGQLQRPPGRLQPGRHRVGQGWPAAALAEQPRGFVDHQQPGIGMNHHGIRRGRTRHGRQLQISMLQPRPHGRPVSFRPPVFRT